MKYEYSLVRSDDIEKIFCDNEYVGYVSDDILFGFKDTPSGSRAVEIGPINHRREILGKLRDWRETLQADLFQVISPELEETVKHLRTMIALVETYAPSMELTKLAKEHIEKLKTEGKTK